MSKERAREIAAAPKISCGCGCGETIPPINKRGEPASYKHGHNPVSIRQFGVPKPPEQIAKKLATHRERYGDKYMSDEAIARLRARRGDKAPGWKGGLWARPYPPEFRRKALKEAIRARDNYECQRCGVPQSECRRALDIHHVNGDKMNNAPSNLVALCNPCNSGFIHRMDESVRMFSHLSDELVPEAGTSIELAVCGVI